MKPKKTMTLDNSSYAGNPAGAKINIFRYAWYYPKWPVMWTIALVGSILLVFGISFGFLVLLLPIACINLFYYIRIKEYFAYGDANPGIVIHVNPTVIAVQTDLKKNIGNYPAIKILRTRLCRTMGRPLELGMYLPTVAQYTRTPNDKGPHWGNFDPRPLECATANRETLERVMSSFTITECQSLEAAVPMLPTASPGLYMLSNQIWEKVPEYRFRDVFIFTLVSGFRTPEKDQPLLASKRKF